MRKLLLLYSNAHDFFPVMISLILIALCLLSGYIIYCSGVDAVCMCSLIQEDASACPKDFLALQTKGRRTVLFNDICRVFCSGVMLIFGMNLLSHSGSTLFPATPAGLATAALLLCLSTLASVVTDSVNGFREVREGIMRQWRGEKRISRRHDDEVRLYRILGEATGIPAINGRMLAYMACLGFLFIFNR